MAYALRIRPADGSERSVPFEELDLPCVIGRDSDQAQVVVPDSRASRAHCRISQEGSGLAVEDLGSRNGTWLNGERITRMPFRPGDRLRVGGTGLDIIISEPKAGDPYEGRSIGGFELQECIGRGRSGSVYRARQAALDRAVAVKLLSEEFRNDPEKLAAFITEAKRAGRLSHPHVVQVHDVIQADGECLLAMELMDESASDRLRDGGPFDELSVLRIIRDTARALAFASERHLVHRDVKPDNILVNEQGIWKLADLGIAIAIGDDGTAVQERVFGTPFYVAPEQAKGGPIDGRADLYALGASAWHLAVGRTVFNGPVRQVVSDHVNTPLPDLRTLAPDLGRGTVDLICRLLAKTPDQRPLDASTVALEADKLITSGARTPLPAKPIRARRRRRRRFH
jgi:serine/threonine protein kinase